RKAIVEEPGGFEISQRHNGGFLSKAVESQSFCNERVIEGPYGTHVVADGVVAAFSNRHRADPPAAEQLWTDQVARAGRCLVVLDDAAPEKMPEIRGQ